VAHRKFMQFVRLHIVPHVNSRVEFSTDPSLWGGTSTLALCQGPRDRRNEQWIDDQSNQFLSP